MAYKKSAMSGEYMIGVLESGGIEVYRVYDNVLSVRWQRKRDSSLIPNGTQDNSEQNLLILSTISSNTNLNVKEQGEILYGNLSLAIPIH